MLTGIDPHPPGVLLDTHIWVQLQSGAPALPKPALDAIELATSTRSVFVSAISVWEIAMLALKRRIEFDRTVRQWVQEALGKPGIQALPLSPEIAITAAEFPSPMQNDPADRMILASAHVERLILITRDKPMLRFARHIGVDCLQG